MPPCPCSVFSHPRHNARHDGARRVLSNGEKFRPESSTARGEQADRTDKTESSSPDNAQWETKGQKCDD